jgi:hypothetical protein
MRVFAFMWAGLCGGGVILRVPSRTHGRRKAMSIHKWLYWPRRTVGGSEGKRFKFDRKTQTKNQWKNKKDKQ